MNNFELDCKNISKLSPKIRYVSILDNAGIKLAGGMCNGKEAYISEKEEEYSTRHSIFHWLTATTLAHKIGEVNYIIQDHEKVKKITFRLSEKTFLFVSVEPNIDILKTINEIIVLIKQI